MNNQKEKMDTNGRKRERQTENLPDYGQIEKRARVRRKAGSAVTYILLVFWGMIVLFPFYWMLLTSVKS